MFAASRKFFLFFLWIFTGSIGATLSYIFFSLLTPLPEGPYLFFPLIYYVCSIAIAISFNSSINIILKSFLFLLLSFILLVFLILCFQFFFKYYFTTTSLYLIFSFNLLLTIVVLTISNRIILGFRRLDMVIENEKLFENKSDYLKWVSEEFGERMDQIEPKWFIRFAINSGTFILILCFLSVAKNRENRIYLSIFTILFFISALGLYLLLYQYSSVIKWRFLGLKVKKEIIKNWNKLIKILLISTLLLSCLIPSNYVILRIDSLTEFLNLFFPVVLPLDKEIKSEELINKDSTLQKSALPDFERYFSLAKNIVYIILIAYFTVILTGFILKLIYRKRDNIPFFLKFFILCFENFIETVLKIYNFFKLILEVLFTKEEKQKIDKKLEKHFYSMFGDYKKLSSEKQKEIESIIKEFIKLIQTTSRFVAPYIFHYGPKEYMEIVIQKAKTVENEIREVVDIFNESRYSLHLLEPEKKEKFKKLIDFIIDKITKMF
jgi:hypothetical protein